MAKTGPSPHMWQQNKLLSHQQSATAAFIQCGEPQLRQRAISMLIDNIIVYIYAPGACKASLSWKTRFVSLWLFLVIKRVVSVSVDLFLHPCYDFLSPHNSVGFHHFHVPLCFEPSEIIFWSEGKLEPNLAKRFNISNRWARPFSPPTLASLCPKASMRNACIANFASCIFSVPLSFSICSLICFSTTAFSCLACLAWVCASLIS